MALIEDTLFGRIDKVQMAIERIKTFEPKEGYYGATSFGKDSIVLMDLTKKAGVKVKWHFHVTTVDPPELLKFGRKYYKDVIWTKPKTTMWKLIIKKKMPPTRLARYCCDYFKEAHGEGIILTGIRWAESNKRRNRKMTEQCLKGKNRSFVNPIIDWEDDDIWEYILSNEMPYCSLYDEGFKRLGCIGCPIAGKNRYKEFERWPKFEKLYRKTFAELIKNRKIENTSIQWSTADNMFKWWMEENINDNPDQIMMFE